MFSFFSSKVCFLLFVLFGIQNPVLAQFSGYSNDFLNLSCNAKSSGLGQSSYHLGPAVWASQNNPASMLTDSVGYQFGVTNQRLYGNLANLSAIAFLIKQQNTAFSISLLRVGVDNIQNTLQMLDTTGNFDFNKISYFSSADYALFLAIARPIGNSGWFWGFNSKYLFRHTGNFSSALGFGIDWAVKKKFRHFDFSFIYKDFGGSYTFWKINKEEWEKYDLDSLLPLNYNRTEISPQKIVFAFSGKFSYNEYTFAPEFNIESVFPIQTNAFISTTYFSLSPALGIEAAYKEIFFLRTGFNQLQKMHSDNQNFFLTLKTSFGFGIRIKQFSLDYAFTNAGNSHLLPSSHVFSLQLHIF